jgi:hypothetical protein
MSLEITVNKDSIEGLNLSEVDRAIEKIIGEKEINKYEQELQLKIDYPRDRDDPRELSEIPEIRLWFVRLDAKYPWLPFLLDWKTGELARYAAMLVPHQFSRSEGIQYNPEALEIFVMQKIFVLHNWLQQNQIPSQFRLKSMAQIFGYDIDDSFFHNLVNC